MMSWVMWRLLKFIGVSLLAAGLAGAAFGEGRRRQVAAQWLASGGLLLTWIPGYGMMKLTERSMGEPWISASLLASMVAVHGALALSRKGGLLPGLASAAGFLGALWLMVYRPDGGVAWIGALVPMALAAASLFTSADGEAEAASAVSWFRWVARAEGLSLLFLFGVYMPLKYAAGIVLDDGEGWAGWVHGVLFLLYLMALWHAGRLAGWSWGRMIAGGVAANLPFGTFVFEHRIKDR